MKTNSPLAHFASWREKAGAIHVPELTGGETSRSDQDASLGGVEPIRRYDLAQRDKSEIRSTNSESYLCRAGDRLALPSKPRRVKPAVIERWKSAKWEMAASRAL